MARARVEFCLLGEGSREKKGARDKFLARFAEKWMKSVRKMGD